MDIFEELLKTIVEDICEPESRSERIEKLEKEAAKDELTINRADFTHILAGFTAFYMHEDPKLGIALLKVGPLLVNMLFDSKFKETLLKSFKEDK